MNREEMNEALEGTGAMLANGYDDCILGIAERCSKPLLVVYDTEKILEKLIDRDGMTYEEAREFFDFNIAGAWVGEGTPLFLTRLIEED